MALRVTSEGYSGGDLSWLGSRHGVATARTGTLKASAFTDEIVRSGTPVTQGEDGLYVPYAGGPEVAPTGFVINDVIVDGADEPVAILDHGRIVVDKLPVEGFTLPTAPGAFTYL